MKVLIAEDDAVSRKLLEVTLTRLGYEVESFDDCSRASSSDIMASPKFSPSPAEYLCTGYLCTIGTG